MIIKGDRINLRKLKKSDAESIQKHAKDKEISRYTILPHPYKLKHAQDFINLTHKKMRKKESYEFGIELKVTKKIIGMMGLINIDFENKKAEVGYWLGKKYWKQGLTTESLKLILKFGFRELKLEKIYAKVMCPNMASANLLKKNGFKLEGKLRKNTLKNGKFMDDLIYGLLKEEWKK